MKFFPLTAFFFSFLNTLAQDDHAPAFTDSNRLARVMATKPLVDRLYQEHAATNHFPGMVYGVVVDGQLVYSGSTGFTDVSKKIPAHAASAFRIASMTKSFTALAILILRDEGRLRLDDAATRYLPELRRSTLLTTDAPAITIRHLLTHAAGLPEDNPWGDRQLADTNAELMRLAGELSFSHVPGVAYEYSNVGFALLGRIITVVSGMPYQQFISDRILKPLGMNHSFWEYTNVPPASLAHGYRWEDSRWKEESLLHDGSYGAMGGLITTLDDFTKYLNLHLGAWPPRSTKENSIIKRSSLREMQMASNFSSLNPGFRYASGRPCATASAYGYGLRWMNDCSNRVYVGHTGGLPGFGSNWNILPEYSIGVICFANLTYAPTAGFNINILDTIVRLADLHPRQIPPSAILQKRQQQLVQVLPGWEQADRAGLFAENFFSDYSVADLKRQCELLFAKAGTILNVLPVEPENQLRGSFLMVGEKATLQVRFTLTPEKNPLIQEFQIRERSR